MRLRDHIEKLNYYVAAVENESLRKASQSLGVGQPQLSKVIKQLEELLESQLIIRSRKGISTTPEGEKLYREGKKLLDQVDRLEFSLHSKNQNLKGDITIGTYDSISRYFFPDFIKYMKTLFPDLNINLYTGRSRELLQKLKKSQIDLAVYVGRLKSTKIFTQTVFEDSFSFFASTNLDNSFQNNLIYFPDSMQEVSFKSLTKGFDTFHNCENLETVLSLTLSGLGQGLLPRRVAREYVLSGSLKETKSLKNLSPHEISISRPKNSSTDESKVVYEEVFRFLSIWSQK